jgi:hypothetical protein
MLRVPAGELDRMAERFAGERVSERAEIKRRCMSI